MQQSVFWNQSLDQIYAHLHGRKEGLTNKEARNRLKRYGPNRLKPPTRGKGFILLLNQFKSPLVLLLIGAATLSISLGSASDASIILAIVVLSGLLGFFQEHKALNALEKVMKLVEIKARVIREGKETEIAVEQIVPGDIVCLRAGSLIPADCVIIESKYLFVDEATLTGESVPVEKSSETLEGQSSPFKKTNALFLGTVVTSGTALAIVVATGFNTEYSKISERLRFRPPKTAFEIGVRKFGLFLLQVTAVLVIVIFIFNVVLKKPIVDSFLFSLAIAVGLTPQLLPAIISVNLSHGARRMAAQKVIVKRLAALENFGQMNILCADKTGTLTVGKIQFSDALDSQGKKNEKAAFFGFLNAHFQAGYTNPLDQAILNALKFDTSDWKKIDEIPYDFHRKCLSIVFEKQGKQLLIVKGAFPQVLSLCNRVELSDGKIVFIDDGKKSELENCFEEQNKKGFRSLGLAYVEGQEEKNLIFLGFLQFYDPIKPDIVEVVEELKKKGVFLKILTGDHQSVAAYVATVLGVTHAEYITGDQLKNLSDAQLQKVVKEKHVFAQMEPLLKERIILALRKSGNVVGYLGDGINDASALHSADVGIAVDSGADAAKEAADFVLMKKDLSVLRAGIEEGRRTFINTLKYVYMATSANFGNMFSMAGISIFLKFLPMLPKQVLLTNFFSDLPEMALATDNVDPELVNRPVKWDVPFIRRFMLVFGILNSMADYLTFGVLLLWFHADETLFQTGWFIENVVSAALVALAIRTRRSLFRSKPNLVLTLAVLGVAVLIPLLPYTSLGRLFGFRPIPLSFYLALGVIIVIYIVSVEIAKRFFFWNHKRNGRKHPAK